MVAAAPVRIDVAAVGLSSSVVPVGQTSDGSITVPPPTVAGWYHFGPAPGALGPAVLVGHVDSHSRTAVFYGLARVRPGDTVRIVRADNSAVEFRVNAVTVVNKAAFPTAAVFAPTDDAELRLVTCTGAFDTTTHHYVDSLIVWATMTA